MTDWDKELAKIDKQLASISDEELMASAAAQSPAAPAAAPGKGATRALPASPAAAAAAARPSAAAGAVPGRAWVSWIKVIVAVAAAAGLMFWPWPARCGLPVVGFTAATFGVALLGIWSAIGTWRHRLGLAHIASLLVTVWGFALGAREILPRVGYAIPSSERPATWSCDGLPAAPAPVPGEAADPAAPTAVPPASPTANPEASSGTSFPG